MRKKTGGRRWLWLIILGIIGLLTGCSGKEKLEEFQVQYLDCFDTVSMVTVCARNQAEFDALEPKIHEELLRYHKLFDIYENYENINNLKTVNDQAGQKPVKVSRDIIRLLDAGMDAYEKTDGKVNIAMGSVLSIWHDYRSAGLKRPDLAQLPDMETLKQAALHTDIRKIRIDREASTVFFEDPEMKLDVGAIAKGFAVEQLCDRMVEWGVTSAIVSAGGNVKTIGTRADGSPWRVGVQNPDTGSSQPYLHILKLKDVSLVTSGVYQRYYTVNGKNYHHIIDPDTLMPSDGFASVTILCEDSMLADAWSTAVFNMSFEDGKQFIESLENTEALWVMPDGTEEASSGFAAWLDADYER